MNCIHIIILFPLHNIIVLVWMSLLFNIDNIQFHDFSYGMLTGDSGIVYCDSCSFLIYTDQHGHPLSDKLCPVRKFSAITCHDIKLLP